MMSAICRGLQSFIRISDTHKDMTTQHITQLSFKHVFDTYMHASNKRERR